MAAAAASGFPIKPRPPNGGIPGNPGGLIMENALGMCIMGLKAGDIPAGGDPEIKYLIIYFYLQSTTNHTE